MSVQRMSDTVEGLQLLRDIVDLVNNPKPLLDAHEAAKNIVAIDIETKSKVAQAQNIIKQADDVSKEIEAKKKQIDIASTELELNKSSFNKKKEDAEKNIKQRECELDNARNLFAQYEENTRTELEDKSRSAGAIIAKQDKIISELDAREKNIKSGEIDLAHKLQEAEKIRRELATKAEGVRKQLEGF